MFGFINWYFVSHSSHRLIYDFSYVLFCRQMSTCLSQPWPQTDFAVCEFKPQQVGCGKWHKPNLSLNGARKEVFYLTTHSTHFIYGYMASDIWLRTILIVRKETRCHHIGYSYRLTAMVLLYAPSHRQDSTYHGLCYTSSGALAGREIAQWVHPMKDRSDDPSHHERTLYLWAMSRSLLNGASAKPAGDPHSFTFI